MELKDVCAILEARYAELSRLAADDMAISIDWYDGAKQELKRTIRLLKRHLTSQSSEEAGACPFCDCVVINEMGHCEGCGKLTRPPP